MATTLALVLVTLFSMVFGELMSQFLGISAPLAAAKVVAGPVRAFAMLARPLVAVLNGSANAALRAMGVTPVEELSGARTPQELASLVRRSAEQGTLEAGTARLLTRSLDFGERTAADVMTPRVRCSGIERTARADDVIRLARHTGHSRFPVIGDDWDDIDGLVHVKKAIAVPHDRRPDVPVSALMVPPVMVPETIRLDPLLLQLRAAAACRWWSSSTSTEGPRASSPSRTSSRRSSARSATSTTGRSPTGTRWPTARGCCRASGDRTRCATSSAPSCPDGPTYETVGGFAMAVLGPHSCRR